MKGYKKLAALTCALVMLIALVPAAQAIETDEMVAARVTQEFTSTEEYQRHVAANPEGAQIALQNAIDHELAMQAQSLLRGGDASNAYVTIPLIRQPTYYTCGPTSVLQALYGAGYADAVPGKTDKEKIEDTLWPECSVSGTAYVYRVVDTLNNYNTSAGYTYVEGNKHSASWFELSVMSGLVNDNAPILHAKTQYIGYYNGHESGHFICVSGVNRNTGKVTVEDCNYNDPYYGSHTITSQEAVDCIGKVSGRYLITA